MKKVLFSAVALTALILIICLSACVGSNILDEVKTYEINSDIHTLSMKIGAAKITIHEGDEFSVESNLKYLKVSDEGGVLSLIEDHHTGVTDEDSMLTLTVPHGHVFDSIDIETGAASIEADTLSAGNLRLMLGAGDVTIDSISATSEAEITGGAGNITIEGGNIANLALEMGVGNINFTLSLSGENELEMGVGNARLELLGGKENYSVEITKGVGNIKVDGKEVTDFGISSDSGCTVDIEGGVGNFDLFFK